MPYISQQRRKDLYRPLYVPPALPLNAGELAYLLQQEVDGYLKNAPGGYRFENIAEVFGAIEAVKLDFYERIVRRYESVKQATNGDVWSEEVIP